MDMLMRDMTLNIASRQLPDDGSIGGKTEHLTGQKEEFSQLMKKEESRSSLGENICMLQPRGIFFTAIPQAQVSWAVQAFDKTAKGRDIAGETAVAGERIGFSEMETVPLKEMPAKNEKSAGTSQAAGGTEVHKRLPGADRAEQTELPEAAGMRKGQLQAEKSKEASIFQNSFQQAELQKLDEKTLDREEDGVQVKEVFGLSEIKDVRENEPVREKKILVWKPAEQSDSIQKLADLVQKTMTSKGKEMEIQLEPAQLGKIVIKAVYEAGKASVLIACSSEKTMELLSGHAREIGGILQDRMGEPTAIVIDRRQEEYWRQNDGQGSSGKEEEQRNRKERQSKKIVGLEGDFLQQLRLGIV